MMRAFAPSATLVETKKKSYCRVLGPNKGKDDVH